MEKEEQERMTKERAEFMKLIQADMDAINAKKGQGLKVVLEHLNVTYLKERKIDVSVD